MKIAKLASAFAGLVLSASALQANAVPFEVDITVDNSYALYYGTATEATNFVGSNGSWYEAEHYAFDLPSSNFIYVVTESDVATAQGFLAQFTNLLTNQRFYSNDSQWQVTATGRRGLAPYDSSATALSELSAQLVAANGGSNPSGGWVGTTAGATNGASPWGTIANIDSAARWSWYNSNGSVDPTIGGYDHDEYLIFRISVGATEVPEPSTIMLLSLGLLGLVAARKRKA